MTKVLTLALTLLAARAAHAEPSSAATATLPSTPVLETQAPSQEEKGSESKAVKLSVDNKSDVVSALRGGSNSAPTYLGALTLGADLNFERLIPAAKGLTGTIQGLGLYGQSPSNRIGDYQGADQIAAAPGAELYQAWLQKNFFADRLSLLAGLQDLNNEFYTTDSSTNFMNTSFVIGPEVVRSGRQGPSVWPATTLGGRVRVQATEQVQLAVALYDGIPGDPASPGHSGLTWRESDGVMAIAELAITPKINGLSGKYALGGWGYDRSLDDLSRVDDDGVPVAARSQGIYFLLDQKIYAPAGAEGPGLSAFLRLGWADAASDPIEYAGQSGLLYTGLLPGREQDQLGLGAAVARSGINYRDAASAKGNELALYEAAIEVMYRARVRSWLWVQPDLQWIAAPGMNPSVADAFVAAGRVQLTL